MQNLAPFQMTSNFDHKYLRNGWRYSKSDKYSINRDSSRVRQKVGWTLLQGPNLQKNRTTKLTQKLRQNVPHLIAVVRQH